MTSDKKYEANRRNAARSTGPRSEAGKRASSRNALKGGLLAKIASLPQADRDEYAALLSELEGYWKPAGALEVLLVEEITTCAWRCRRALQVECEIFEYHRLDRWVCRIHEEHERRRQGMVGTEELTVKPPSLKNLRKAAADAADERDGAASLALDFNNGSAMLERMMRYRTTSERSYYRAIDYLERVQALRFERSATDFRSELGDAVEDADASSNGGTESETSATGPSTADDEGVAEAVDSLLAIETDRGKAMVDELEEGSAGIAVLAPQEEDVRVVDCVGAEMIASELLG